MPQHMQKQTPQKHASSLPSSLEEATHAITIDPSGRLHKKKESTSERLPANAITTSDSTRADVQVDHSTNSGLRTTSVT